MTQAFSVIILLAVGSDYKLLVVSRFKEEIGAGINSHEIQQAAQHQMHWFFPMDYNGHRANSEELGDELRRSADRRVARSQQGRRRPHDRHVHRLPAERHVRVVLVASKPCP
jgi:MMPL family